MDIGCLVFDAMLDLMKNLRKQKGKLRLYVISDYPLPKNVTISNEERGGDMNIKRDQDVFLKRTHRGHGRPSGANGEVSKTTFFMVTCSKK